MAKLFPSAFNGKVALVGHSQGGHSVFASLYYQPTYAPDVNIVATAAYSPLWINQATWGALFVEAQYYPLATAPSTDAVSVWYHYTHSELLDGPGHGLDLFQDAAAAAVQHFMDNDCWDTGYDGADAATAYPDLQAVAKTVTDLYTPDFINAIEGPAAFGQPCADDGGLCSTWVARYAADRPHLPSSTPPIFIEYGSEDETIPANRMACVVQRLDQDSVNYSFCLNPGVGHQGVVRVSASNVVQWLASKTLGEAPPAACAETFANLVDDAGQTITCATPPPNN
jgi:pimeloyl-ACP methyl ester carboxylesterase